MKNDIRNREDIAALVNAFYDKVKVNPVIGHFFSEVVDVNWEKHLPVMYDFWEGIVFGAAAYTGNPINAHKKVHALHAFSKADFEEWLRLFHQTVDEMYAGEKAELIKQRATSIATVMQLKVIHNNQFYG
jgi:hemoglobin